MDIPDRPTRSPMLDTAATTPPRGWLRAVVAGAAVLLGCGGGQSGSLGVATTDQGVTTDSTGADTAPSGGRISPSFFGIHVNQPQNWPASGLEFAGWRSIDSFGCQWANIHTGPGTYDFTRCDAWVAKAKASKMDILFSLYGTPSWISVSGLHSSHPNTNCQSNALLGPGLCDRPGDLEPDGTGTDETLKAFVTALMDHYGPGTIKYFEIWNEPNIDSEWNNEQVILGSSEKTTRPLVAPLVRMADDAWSIIKAEDPGALVVSPPVVLTTSSAPNWLAPYFAAGGAAYTDVVGFHSYVQTPGIVCPDHCPVAESVIPVVEAVKSVAARSGLQDKPLFATEGSWGVTSMMTDPDLETAFTARFYLLQLSESVTRFYWFGYDYENTGEFFDPTTRKLSSSGVAYEQLYGWVVGSTLTEPCSSSGSRWSCHLTLSDGSPATILWDTAESCSDGVCTTTDIPVSSSFTLYEDLLGNAFAIVGHNVPIGLKPVLVH
jgi:Glycosyl hydrolase catalytic core